MPPITHGARRIATRLATITAMGTAMGITAVGCEAPRDTSQGALEAPVTIEAREEDAGTDAAVIEVVTEDVNEDEATPSEAAPAARHGAFFDELDAPVQRVCSLDSPAIYSPPLEALQLPTADVVVAKALSIC
jgi:hypothetical protein